jgi:hypothetical protein
MDDNLVVALSGEAGFSGDATSLTGSNNLFNGAAAPSGITGTVTGAPMFVAASNHDFRLLPGSPGVDQGIATPAATDADGTARPQGAAFDIGAYELVP